MDNRIWLWTPRSVNDVNSEIRGPDKLETEAGGGPGDPTRLPIGMKEKNGKKAGLAFGASATRKARVCGSVWSVVNVVAIGS